jgi:hypothetical protein
MTYAQSIQRIKAAEAHYHRQCDLGETDSAIGAALDILHRAKADHRKAFGTLGRFHGAWF